MANITKTIGNNILTLRQVAASGHEIGTVEDLNTDLAMSIYVQHGRRAETAAADGATIRVDVSSKSSGEGHWHTHSQVRTDFVVAASEALLNAEAVGDTIMEVSLTAGLAAQDKIFFNNATAANAEWGIIKSIVTDVSFTLETGLKNAQASGTVVFNKAHIFGPIVIDLTSLRRVRVVYDGTQFNQISSIEAFYTLATAIG